MPDRECRSRFDGARRTGCARPRWTTPRSSGPRSGPAEWAGGGAEVRECEGLGGDGAGPKWTRAGARRANRPTTGDEGSGGNGGVGPRAFVPVRNLPASWRRFRAIRRSVAGSVPYCLPRLCVNRNLWSTAPVQHHSQSTLTENGTSIPALPRRAASPMSYDGNSPAGPSHLHASLRTSSNRSRPPASKASGCG